MSVKQDILIDLSILNRNEVLDYVSQLESKIRKLRYELSLSRKEGRILDIKQQKDDLSQLEISLSNANKALKQLTLELTRNQNANKVSLTSYDGLKSNLKQLTAQYKLLTTEQRNSIEGSSMLNNIQKVSNEIQKINKELKTTESIPQKLISSSIGKLSAIFVLTEVVEKISQMGREILDFNISLSRAQTNVERVTNLSEQEVDNLTTRLQKLKTVTSTIELLDIAKIGGKQGITGAKAIEEYVKAIDILAVALKDEFGNSVEFLAEKITKLNTILNGSTNNPEELRKEILFLGNAINVLSQNSIATGEEMVEFASRIGRTLKPLGALNSEILALATVFQELNLQPEQGSTAINNLLKDLGSNTKEFSKILKINEKEIRDTFNVKPIQAFFDIINRINEISGSDNAKKLQLLKDLKQSGEGVGSVILQLSDKLDLYNQRANESSKAIQSVSSVQNEFNRTLNSAGGAVDNYTKALEELKTSGLLEDLASLTYNFAAGLIRFISDSVKGVKELLGLRLEFTNVQGLVSKINTDEISYFKEQQKQLAVNINLLKSGNITQKQRLEILTQLRDTFPDVFKNYNIEGIELKHLNTIYDQSIITLKKYLVEKIKLKKQEILAEKLFDLEEERLKKQTDIETYKATDSRFKNNPNNNSYIINANRNIEKLDKAIAEVNKELRNTEITSSQVISLIGKDMNLLQQDFKAHVGSLQSVITGSLKEIDKLNKSVDITNIGNQPGIDKLQVELGDIYTALSNINTKINYISKSSPTDESNNRITVLNAEAQTLINRVETIRALLENPVKQGLNFPKELSEAELKKLKKDIEDARNKITKFREDLSKDINQGDLDVERLRRDIESLRLELLYNEFDSQRVSLSNKLSNDLFDIEAEIKVKQKILSQETSQQLTNLIESDSIVKNILNSDKQLLGLINTDISKFKDLLETQLQRLNIKAELIKTVYTKLVSDIDVKQQELSDKLVIYRENLENEILKLDADIKQIISQNALNTLTTEISIESTQYKIELNKKQILYQQYLQDNVISRTEYDKLIKQLDIDYAKFNADQLKKNLNEYRTYLDLVAQAANQQAKLLHKIETENAIREADDSLSKLDEDFNNGLYGRDTKSTQALENYANVRAEIEKKLADTLSNIDRILSETIQQNTIETKDKSIEAESQIYEATVSYNEKLLDSKDNLLSKYRDIYQQLIAEARNFADTYYDIERDRIDRSKEYELRNIEEKYEHLIELAEGNQTIQDALRNEEEFKRIESEKRAFARSKRLMLSQAKLNAALAVTSILAQYPKFDGGIAMGIALSAALLSTAREIAKIQAMEFFYGGFTTKNKKIPINTNNSKEPAGIVHANEYVAPNKQVLRHSWLFEKLDSERNNPESTDKFLSDIINKSQYGNNLTMLARKQIYEQVIKVIHKPQDTFNEVVITNLLQAMGNLSNSVETGAEKGILKAFKKSNSLFKVSF